MLVSKAHVLGAKPPPPNSQRFDTARARFLPPNSQFQDWQLRVFRKLELKINVQLDAHGGTLTLFSSEQFHSNRNKSPHSDLSPSLLN